jgi:sphinganine-1-phosphate aldolase
MPLALPATGTAASQVLASLRQHKHQDAKWREGHTFSLVYFAGDEALQLLKDATAEFISENGLSPVAFPSLRQMESDVVSMTASLFSAGDEVCGTLTSGGTESILMAVKTARDWARAKGVSDPEMIVPRSAHPAFDKAAHYLNVKLHHAELLPDFRVDMASMADLINRKTALLVGSAMGYPHGVVDDIASIAALAHERHLLCHVDACLGGFVLPFVRKLGQVLAPFDFGVPGVTSLSVDLHKYGYAAKGASVLLHRNADLRRHQFFTYSGWNGGLYASPSMSGTRPGGPIAAAWAILKHLGEAGYLERTNTVMETTRSFLEAIQSIEGLYVLGNPLGPVFAFSSSNCNIYELGDALQAKGWRLDRQQHPPALHCMVTPIHATIAPQFIADLKACAESLVKGEAAPEGSAAMYGMMATIENAQDSEGFLLEFLDGIFERS